VLGGRERKEWRRVWRSLLTNDRSCGIIGKGQANVFAAASMYSRPFHQRVRVCLCRFVLLPSSSTFVKQLPLSLPSPIFYRNSFVASVQSD
jgi:hypothetical protein